jgi:hypothetical protein
MTGKITAAVVAAMLLASKPHTLIPTTTGGTGQALAPLGLIPTPGPTGTVWRRTKAKAASSGLHTDDRDKRILPESIAAG